jgi:8-oxo-dGTP pyrophosphatase MutT (NUDIX family)
MAMSPYIRRLRDAVGHDLLVLPSVTGIVFDAQDRLLVVEDADTGTWVAPGGFIEPGEHPAETVVRELREELGIEVEPFNILGVFGGDGFEVVYSNGDRTSYVMTLFECRIVRGTPQPDGEELRHVRWVARDELAGLGLTGWAARVLPLVHEARRRPLFERACRSPDTPVSSRVTYMERTCEGSPGINIRCDGAAALERLHELIGSLEEGAAERVDILRELPAEGVNVRSCVFESIPAEPVPHSFVERWFVAPSRAVVIDHDDSGAARVRVHLSREGWGDSRAALHHLLVEPDPRLMQTLVSDGTACVEVEIAWTSFSGTSSPTASWSSRQTAFPSRIVCS